MGDWLARGVEERHYTRFLSFKGQLQLERGMRGAQLFGLMRDFDTARGNRCLHLLAPCSHNDDLACGPRRRQAFQQMMQHRQPGNRV